MFEKISIIGAGSWGSALAILLADHGLPITLWGHNSKVVEEINTLHTNSAYIPDIAVPPTGRCPRSSADLHGHTVEGGSLGCGYAGDIKAEAWCHHCFMHQGHRAREWKVDGGSD